MGRPSTIQFVTTHTLFRTRWEDDYGWWLGKGVYGLYEFTDPPFAQIMNWGHSDTSRNGYQKCFLGVKEAGT